MDNWWTPPPIGGPGFDLAILWAIGREVLAGRNPYAIPGSGYPPAMTLLFGLLALGPWPLVLLLSVAVNAALFVRVTGASLLRPARLLWLFFFPVMHVFAAGQVDLALVAVIPWLRERDWRAPAAVALLSLKPQVAAVVLPFWLLTWLRSDRRTLLRSALATAVLAGLPLAVRPTVYAEWLAVFAAAGPHKFAGTGLWVLADFLPYAAVGLAAALVAGFGLASREEAVTRSALALAAPVFSYYDTVVLIGSAPWWVLVPASQIAFALSHLLHSFAAFILIPAAALAWNLRPRRVPARLWPVWLAEAR